jgi:hypothetical protein
MTDTALGARSPTAPALWRAKLHAAGLHLALTAAVFVGIVALTIELWYPPPFFWIDGGIQILLLTGGVNIGLGPLLTALVYRPRRPRLWLNLAAIGVIQAVGLAWGLHALYSQRPILAAFVGYPENRFFPVTTAEIAKGTRSLDELRALSKSRPPLVYIDLPGTNKQHVEQIMQAWRHGGSVLRETALFRPIAGKALAEVNAGSRSRATYATEPAYEKNIDRFVAAHGGNLEAFALIPVYGRFGRGLLALSRADGHLVGVVAMQFRLH